MNYVRPSSYRYNPDKYKEHKFLGLVAETERAYLFAMTETTGAWVPKVICRALVYREDKAHQIRVRIPVTVYLTEVQLNEYATSGNGAKESAHHSS